MTKFKVIAVLFLFGTFAIFCIAQVAKAPKKSAPNSVTKADISYWLGGGIAVFYRQNNSEVKAGLIVLAHLEKGVEAFGGPDPIIVKFETTKINE